MGAAQDRCVCRQWRLCSVNQALSFGLLLVAAGLTEDKADVNVRVGWSGVGINLATNSPTPKVLREAVRSLLDTPETIACAHC
jgi:UDP:flavonoid glycosyltransferase YjiC (YdhE family)